MNKRKRIISLTVAVTIILTLIVGIGGLKVVNAKRIDTSIELGNKYIAEGNYKEAILEFEKVIKIDKKNSDIKETVEVLNVFVQAEDLVAKGNKEEAQQKLDEIKDMPKFDIIKDALEELEFNIVTNGLGNSYHNIRQGGQLAYDNEYVYYGIEHILYKKNIESEEVTTLAEDTEFIEDSAFTFITDVNVYKDYIYYVYSKGTESQIIKIKKDGTEKEIIDTFEDPLSYGDRYRTRSVQIIDDTLYHTKETDSGAELNKINLVTGEKEISPMNSYDYPVLMKNEDNTIDLYAGKDFGNSMKQFYDGYYSIKNINAENVDLKNAKQEEGNMQGAIGYNEDFIIFKDASKFIIQAKEDNKITEIKYAQGSNLGSVMNGYYGCVIGDNKIYYVDTGDRTSRTNKIFEIDLNTKKQRFVKTIKNIQDTTEGHISIYRLYEVQGYLAYLTTDGQVIIDKDIVIKNMNNKSEEEQEEAKADVIGFDGAVIDVTGYDLVTSGGFDINNDTVTDTIELYGRTGEGSMDRWPLGYAIIIKDGKDNSVLTSIDIENKGPYITDNMDIVQLCDVNNDGITDINLEVFSGGNGGQLTEVFIYENGSYKNINDELFNKPIKYNIEVMDNFKLSIGVKDTNATTVYELTNKGREALIKQGYYSQDGKATKQIDTDKLSSHKNYGYTVEDIDGDGLNEIIYNPSIDLNGYILSVDIAAEYVEGICTIESISIEPAFQE